MTIQKILFAVSIFISLSLSAQQTNKNLTGNIDSNTKKDVQVYVTSANKSLLFQNFQLSFNSQPKATAPTTITLNPSQVFQEIDGFGAAITGSSCYNLLRMTQANRTKILRETFDPLSGMGYSYIRISIGCSDFSMDEFTCCDTPGIENFRIHELDRRDLFPILKEILTINPQLKILASPWTCPRWMKVNNLKDLQPFNSWTSGQLNPKYYQDYARYFVKYLQAMKKEGFDIVAVTIQNEPLNRGNSVSLYMSWQEQASFVKNALGPQFAKAGIKTKIVVFDHNYNYDNITDQLNYPVKMYADPEVARYVDGAAYHAYGGDKRAMMEVHNAYPEKNLYFTEMSIGSWNYSFDGDLMWSMREIGIGSLNNFCKSVIVWNLMLDENGAPNRPGGCTTCYGAVDISSKDYSTLDRKSHYYTIGHLSKVISPGAKRIGTKGYQPSGLYYTAVENTDGTYGLVALNDSNEPLGITIADETHGFDYAVPAKSVASFRWKK
ncbi:MAG: glycoside hydrolase family 30 beta sandwich domain-containing protein [Paludibacter sp.]|nr:glycoside hydrolase family 30 beta sandwich domain-containing protein [Paludibacter sp.]